MSRSQPEQGNQNPSKRWFQWEGGANAGYFSWWDKEKEERVKVEPPFVFAVLDILGTVTGYSETQGKRIFANELHMSNFSTQALKVRFHGGPEIADGIWRTIKDHVTSKAVDGHFTNSIYIATKIDGELQIANLKLKGAGLGAWMDFEKEMKSRDDIYDGAVLWNGDVTEGKKGSVEYKMPVFKKQSISEETANIANVLDQELQAYLKDYLTAEPTSEAPEDRSGTTEIGPIETDLAEEDIPF